MLHTNTVGTNSDNQVPGQLASDQPSDRPCAYAFYPPGVIPTGDVIWVFGSDLTGRHNRGDARIASNHFAAKPGVASGITGNAYAIPTRNTRRQALPINEIQWAVQAFLSWARAHPGQQFVISRVGNGMAGLSERRIAPMFAGAGRNCIFNEAWRGYLQHTTEGT